MAEVWYLSLGTESLEGEEANYTISFRDCIELFQLDHERWKCSFDEIPDLKTGNPLFDESGYVGVLVRVAEDEASSARGEWDPGWYKSPLTVIQSEKMLLEVRAAADMGAEAE